MIIPDFLKSNNIAKAAEKILPTESFEAAASTVFPFREMLEKAWFENIAYYLPNHQQTELLNLISYIASIYQKIELLKAVQDKDIEAFKELLKHKGE